MPVPEQGARPRRKLRAVLQEPDFEEEHKRSRRKSALVSQTVSVKEVQTELPLQQLRTYRMNPSNCDIAAIVYGIHELAST